MDSTFHLALWGRLQARQCTAPACCCPHALLFVWHEGRATFKGGWRDRVFWELRTREGRRFQGSAPSDDEAKRFGAVTLNDQGLQRMRVIFGRPVEVPRA